MLSRDLIAEYSLEPHELTASRTPNAGVFVLAHLGIPEFDTSEWWVHVCGLVDRPMALDLGELRRYRKETVEAVHRCAGNPADPTEPTRPVANVVWGGVDLRTLLDEAGVQRAASHLWASGLDHGTFAGHQVARYEKDIPLSRIQRGDVLVAYEMNGEPLSARHGFPARLVVPGFYGTNSVKWLARLELADRRADGVFTREFYSDQAPHGTVPVWELAPGSVIVTPRDGAHVVGAGVEVSGWAWSSGDVATVEVSTDGGDSWQPAHVGPRSQYSWQRFSYRWSSPPVGAHRILARATDHEGRTQPLVDARNAIHAVAVEVTASEV